MASLQSALEHRLLEILGLPVGRVLAIDLKFTPNAAEVLVRLRLDNEQLESIFNIAEVS